MTLAPAEATCPPAAGHSWPQPNRQIEMQATQSLGEDRGCQRRTDVIAD